MDDYLHNFACIIVNIFSFTDINGHFSFTNYQQIFQYKYFEMFWDSILYAALITMITLFISYPTAYFIRNAKILISGY